MSMTPLDGIPFTTPGGLDDRTAMVQADRAEADEALAQQIADSAAMTGSYEALVTEIVLQPSPVAGSSGTIANVVGVPVNTFADAANSFASWTLAVPSHWSTFDVKIEHAVASGTGNVVMRADVGWLGDGDSLAVTNGIAATFAVGTTIATRTLGSGLAATPSKLLTLRVIRLGSDAADTFTGVQNVRAVRLLKTS